MVEHLNELIAEVKASGNPDKTLIHDAENAKKTVQKKNDVNASATKRSPNSPARQPGTL